MADVKWIKITTDIFDDEKILLIESLPDADAIIVIWLKLLCLAGKTNNNGVFIINDKIPYTEKMLATIFRRKESTVSLALQTFEQFGMIEIVDNVITIPNWGKHQNLDSLEKKNDYMKNYMREYRAKQKEIACKVNSKTNSKSNVSRTEQEEEKEVEKNNTITSEFESEFETLWKKYPRKDGKKKALTHYIAARRRGVSCETISEGIDRYVDYINKAKVDPRYIKMGSSWFCGACWDDEYKAAGIKPKNKFNDFEQREYDDSFFEELEQKMIGG